MRKKKEEALKDTQTTKAKSQKRKAKVKKVETQSVEETKEVDSVVEHKDEQTIINTVGTAEPVKKEAEKKAAVVILKKEKVLQPVFNILD
jgi:uncharacterized membrane protein